MEMILREDRAHRIREVRAFVSLLDQIEGNFSIFLDAPWGQGKSFFVREVSLYLEEANPYSGVGFPRKFGIGNESQLLSKAHLPVYFNAWEHDYSDEPILSLMGVVFDGYASNLKDQDARSFRQRALKLLNSVKISITEIRLPFASMDVEFDPSSAADSLVDESVLESLRADEDIRIRLKDLLASAHIERADRLVLFVDELDRCRPVYAVKMLEAIKFLFNMENLTIVFSTDCRALGQTVCGCYGEGFDGEGYLSRFYDLKFHLPPIEPENRLWLTGFATRSEQLPWSLAKWLTENDSLSFRDQLKFNERLMSYSTVAGANIGYANDGHIFVRNVLVPAVLHCSIADPELCRRFLKGDEQSWLEFWNVYGECADFERSVRGFSKRAAQWEIAGAEDPEVLFIDGICPELFGKWQDACRFTDILCIGADSAPEAFRDALKAAYLSE